MDTYDTSGAEALAGFIFFGTLAAIVAATILSIIYMIIPFVIVGKLTRIAEANDRTAKRTSDTNILLETNIRKLNLIIENTKPPQKFPIQTDTDPAPYIPKEHHKYTPKAPDSQTKPKPFPNPPP